MFYIIFILFTQTTILFSQDITSIQIQGSKKTKDYIILREIKQKINQELDSTNLIEDQNRIYNLGLFSTVDIEIIQNSENNNHIYMVTVSEMWYVWPFPIVKYDNQSEKFSYGGGIAHDNFRGRNENIAIGTTTGNVKEYFLWYENPWISGNHNSLEMGIYNESSDHHVYSIIEKDRGLFSQGGFYKGDNHKFNFWLHYNNKLIENIENSGLDKDVLDQKYLNQLEFVYLRIGSQYKYDTRDIYVDPKSGIFFNIKLNNIFGFNDTQNIYAIEANFNIYKNLFSNYFNPVFRYKFSSELKYSNSDLPIFSKKYIGGQGYVRGYSSIPSNNPINNSKKMIEVDNFVINTFEIQSTLIERKEYIEKVEMGIDFVFFTDWGTGYNLGESINLDNSLLGYGLGLKIFILGGVIKLDYGFNIHGTSKSHLF